MSSQGGAAMTLSRELAIVKSRLEKEQAEAVVAIKAAGSEGSSVLEILNALRLKERITLLKELVREMQR